MSISTLVDQVLSVERRESLGVERPFVLLSCAASIDGYIDDATENRLLLSNNVDFDRVDAERADCDAILVGSTTIRHDNPRLVVRSQDRRDARLARGLPATPTRVTVTRHGDLDPTARFFTADDTDKIVYTATSALDTARRSVGGVATVVDAGDPVDLAWAMTDLAGRGVRKLMVEGGSSMHTQFLTAGLADELQLVVAPFFVGDSRAPRFVSDGRFPWTSDRRARLADVTTIDDVVLLRCELSDRTARHERRHRTGPAVAELSRLSPPSPTHYAVGAIIVDHNGVALATGYTGETDPRYHAEGGALAKLAGRRDLDLSQATIYTSLEPCTARKSQPDPSINLILAAGIERVVLALRGPLLFADCDGVETLRQRGVDVVETSDLGDLVGEINAHVLGSRDRRWSPMSTWWS